jgi:hypothetical protein
MADYRLYYLGADGKIFAADAIQADSDEAAISIAQMKAASTQLDKIEVWERTRRVWPPPVSPKSRAAD